MKTPHEETSESKQIYLDIVAAFGTTPLDEPAVKEIITQTLTDYQENAEKEKLELVKKLELKMAPRSHDPHSNDFEHGYDTAIYDAIQTIKETLTPTPLTSRGGAVTNPPSKSL